MTIALKCDRCGTYYESDRRPLVKYVIDKFDSNLARDVLDICPECEKSFVIWANAKAEGNKLVIKP